MLRERIKAWADIVRLSDVKDIGPAAEGEEIVAATWATATPC
jgi:uronate dehydrogenase